MEPGRWLVLGVCLVAITTGHVVTGRTTHGEHVVHVILRGTFLIPILLAALWYGIAGAVSVVTLVTVLFLVHVRTAWLGQAWENANQMAMLGVFWVTGLMTGVLTTLERRAERLRRQAEGRLQREVLVAGLAALEAALKSRDEYTGAHGEAVSTLATKMARHLGLSDDQIECVRLAGLVHDVGKIGVRDDVLYKAEAFAPDELARMRQHPQIAADILAAVPGTQHIARVVRAHHEFLDGSGYPDGLRGSAIPIEAQVITVADVYCAITDDRPYHASKSTDFALGLLADWGPARVSTAVVQALRSCVQVQINPPGQEIRESGPVPAEPPSP